MSTSRSLSRQATLVTATSPGPSRQPSLLTRQPSKQLSKQPTIPRQPSKQASLSKQLSNGSQLPAKQTSLNASKQQTSANGGLVRVQLFDICKLFVK